jgi:tetratricopeptide (TPR) repeat protein
MPQVKAAALRAVELHEKDPEAHAMLGVVAGAFDYDWWEALRQCRLALACEPASPTARQLCAQFILIPLRRFDEAIAILEPLLTVDPLSLLPRKTLADALFMGGSDRERAIEELRRLLELDDGFWLAHFALGNIYSARGMMQQAIAAYEKGLEIAPFPPMIGRLASLYARGGDRARAEQVLGRLAAPKQANGRAKGYMFYHLDRSEFDQAAEYLHELIEAREPDVIWLGCNPSFGGFQEFPRFRALLQRMNLADVPP